MQDQRQSPIFSRCLFRANSLVLFPELEAEQQELHKAVKDVVLSVTHRHKPDDDPYLLLQHMFWEMRLALLSDGCGVSTVVNSSA